MPQALPAVTAPAGTAPDPIDGSIRSKAAIIADLLWSDQNRGADWTAPGAPDAATRQAAALDYWPLYVEGKLRAMYRLAKQRGPIAAAVNQANAQAQSDEDDALGGLS